MTPGAAARSFCRHQRMSGVLLLLLCPCFLLASLHTLLADSTSQASDIRGVVADSSTGERIPGASVMIRGTTRGAATNNNGFYLISSVPVGRYDVVVSAVGYSPRTVRVMVTGEQPLTLNVKLSVRVIEIGELVVQSEGVNTLTERSASVHVVTPQELQRIPAAAQPDLLRSLQTLPGVSSTSDVSAKFYVRGGAGDQNLILLDGMRIYNPFHAFGLFSVLDPDIIRNAEVYTAAFPAGYGGRLSSVVNVTTRDGNHSRISGLASVNSLSGKLELDGPFSEENTWLVSGRSSLFSNAINRLIPNPSPTTFYDLFFKGTIGTSTGRFGVRGYTSGDDVEPTAPEQPSHSWRNSAFSLVFSSLATDRTYLDASLSYSRSQVRRHPKPGSAITPASSLIEEFSMRGEATVYMEDEGTLREGLELNAPTIFDSLYTANGSPVAYKQNSVEFYGWVRYDGSAGPFRYDVGVHSDLSLLLDGGMLRNGVQPRLTLSYDIDGNWRVKASYGLFTQKVVTVSNEDDLISLFDAWVYLPDELQPEEASHAVLGIDGNILGSLSTSLQVYTKSYRSISLYNAAKVFPDEPDYIRGTALAYGGELLLRYSSRLMDLYCSYGLSKVSLTANGFTYAPRYDRKHSVKAIGTVHAFDGFDMTLHWEYGSGYPFTQSVGSYSRLALTDVDVNLFPSGIGTTIGALGPKNVARLPAYHRLDIGVTYRRSVGLVQVSIGASIINVYGVKNILYYDRTTGRTDYMIPFFPSASLMVEF